MLGLTALRRQYQPQVVPLANNILARYYWWSTGARTSGSTSSISPTVSANRCWRSYSTANASLSQRYPQRQRPCPSSLQHHGRISSIGIDDGRRIPSMMIRSYGSRAHPQRIPEFPIPVAMQRVLEEVELRYRTRAAKWERNRPVRIAKGIQESGPYRNVDETIELAINLNLDPRRPGQALRGSLLLPHGTGKSVKCLVFCSDADIQEKAKRQGHMVGGDDLLQLLAKGDVALDRYSRALATSEWIGPIQKSSLARVLGPRGLMPNPKTNTIFETDDELWSSLQEQANTVTYRTEANGILHFPIGKASFDMEQLLDNVQAICRTVQDIKPEQYGKKKAKKGGGSGGSGGGGKKTGGSGKNVKYWLRASLSSTQGKGIRLDLRTLDPTSPFFMREPE